MSAKNFRQSDPREDEAQNVRCHCGSLMARVTRAGLELKCRRCKRVVTLHPHASHRWFSVELHDSERRET